LEYSTAIWCIYSQFGTLYHEKYLATLGSIGFFTRFADKTPKTRFVCGLSATDEKDRGSALDWTEAQTDRR
jgi:hypothetical protein